MWIFEIDGSSFTFVSHPPGQIRQKPVCPALRGRNGFTNRYMTLSVSLHASAEFRHPPNKSERFSARSSLSSIICGALRPQLPRRKKASLPSGGCDEEPRKRARLMVRRSMVAKMLPTCSIMSRQERNWAVPRKTDLQIPRDLTYNR
jgi:hypothetical protein